MLSAAILALISVLLVSLVSIVGIIFLGMKAERLKDILIYMISFSAGAMFGDAFLHMLPEATSEFGFTKEISLVVLFGIGFSFIVEKVIHWRHCHMPITKEHHHPFALMNLWGDAFHNLIDGLIIGASYLASLPVGLATTTAVILHEIPQEIADYGVLIHGGFSRKKALLVNFLTALTAVIGTLLALIIGARIEGIVVYFLAFAAGNFIYIAGADLIPELHKEVKLQKSFMQVVTFALGVFVMMALLVVG
ncbi:ZIP family metal transporter [Candidatus Woesearchaeota archaeon]|nr:MAG: zinc/iron permease [archaeon GW2011_AR4]MBS3129745.1 ZIP family metal transporter [Candidatus Woesearchaeota archaeon]HIH37437.1 ZIP family metal transporter [Candidatus Woesearchaeota archaeon]HIH48190.1 ZIP family metal transporter [Candidatus Woesearchaeota archaeon]HIJ02874.1 ZIP family metal transporter [Candidatus Woesearchaeota archaeon]